MQKAEGGFLIGREVIPVTAHAFEQVEGADDVGLDEFTRAVNRTIDMALGGEVDDGARFGIRQQVGDEIAITDVAADELVTRITFEFLEVLEIAGVSEQVEVNDKLIGLLQPIEHEVGTNEAGGASNEDGHLLFNSH